jgi:hypothetical protein
MYTVEARVRAGFDHGLPAPGVLIHDVDLRRPNKAQLVSPARGAVGDVAGLFGGWGVGTVFQDSANEVAVSIDRSLDDGFIVTIRHGALPDAVFAAAPRVDRAPDASGLPPRRLGHICEGESRN